MISEPGINQALSYSPIWKVMRQVATKVRDSLREPIALATLVVLGSEVDVWAKIKYGPARCCRGCPPLRLFHLCPL